MPNYERLRQLEDEARQLKRWTDPENVADDIFGRLETQNPPESPLYDKATLAYSLAVHASGLLTDAIEFDRRDGSALAAEETARAAATTYSAIVRLVADEFDTAGSQFATSTWPGSPEDEDHTEMVYKLARELADEVNEAANQPANL